MLTTRLLGSLEFQMAGQSLAQQVTGRTAALLIYLAVTRQPQPRTHLATLLWDNVSEQQARSNLRYRLRNLRKVVGDYVVVSGETIAFNQELPHWVDVTAFTRHLATTPTAAAHDIERTILQESLNLYTGEFLAGFQVEDAPSFERWMLAQRRHLHDLFIRGLQLRTQEHLARGEYTEGLELNRYLLTLEPWREEVHQQRMLLFAYSGQRSAALQQYILCCQILTEELDVPPMEQTTTLYEQIKSGQWFAAQQAVGHRHSLSAITSFAQDVSAPSWDIASQDVTSRDATSWDIAALNGSMPPATPNRAPRFNLGTMPQPAHFYGRQAELTTLHSWIGQEHSRLVAIMGIGGQGKTALAATLVQEIIDTQDSVAEAQRPAHGFTQIVWRSVGGAPSCAETLRGWLQQLGDIQHDAPHNAQRDLQREELPSNFDQLISRLFAILQEQRCLLVLDGVEAIMERPGAEDALDKERLRADREAYNTLFRLFFQRRHRSCLLLTSRLRPAALTLLDQRNGAYHALELGGLTAADGAAIFAAHGIVEEPTIRQQLHQRYAGNPLLLGQAATLIYNLFAGDVAAFLREESFFLGDIGAVHAQQLAQLSPLERQVMQMLAKADQPLERQTLWENLAQENLTQENLAQSLAKQHYIHALQNLHRAFLIQSVGTAIKLPDVLVAYLAEHDLVSA